MLSSASRGKARNWANAEWLPCLADEAWKELLKEKIKKQIEANSGAKLDQMAKIIAETNQQKWQVRISGKKLYYEFKEKLKGIFS